MEKFKLNKKPWLYTLSLLVLLGCSQTATLTPATDNVTDDPRSGPSGINELELSERERLLEYYQQLRLEEQKNPQLRRQRVEQQLQAERSTSRQSQRTRPSRRSPQLPQRQSRQLDQQKKIQAEQMIDYQCIVIQKENCTEKKEQIMSRCQDKYIHHQVNSFIACIRRQTQQMKSMLIKPLPQQVIHLSYNNNRTMTDIDKKGLYQ